MPTFSSELYIASSREKWRSGHSCTLIFVPCIGHWDWTWSEIEFNHFLQQLICLWEKTLDRLQSVDPLCLSCCWTVLSMEFHSDMKTLICFNLLPSSKRRRSVVLKYSEMPLNIQIAYREINMWFKFRNYTFTRSLLFL